MPAGNQASGTSPDSSPRNIIPDLPATSANVNSIVIEPAPFQLFPSSALPSSLEGAPLPPEPTPPPPEYTSLPTEYDTSQECVLSSPRPTSVVICEEEVVSSQQAQKSNTGRDQIERRGQSRSPSRIRSRSESWSPPGKRCRRSRTRSRTRPRRPRSSERRSRSRDRSQSVSPRNKRTRERSPRSSNPARNSKLLLKEEYTPHDPSLWGVPDISSSSRPCYADSHLTAGSPGELTNVSVGNGSLVEKTEVHPSITSQRGPTGPSSRDIALSSSVKRPDDNCTLELRNIPNGLNTISHLNDHFAKFGNIVNIQLYYENNSESALVTFANHSEADAAYRSTEAVLNNRFIKLLWHSAQVGISQETPLRTDCSECALHSTAAVTVRATTASTTPKDLASSTQVVASANSTILADKKRKEIDSILKQRELLAAKVAEQKIEKQRADETLKLKAELEQRKKQLLEKQFQQLKLVVNKLDQNRSTMSNEEKKVLLETVKSLQGAIQTTRSQMVMSEQPKPKVQVDRKVETNYRNQAAGNVLLTHAPRRDIPGIVSRVTLRPIQVKDAYSFSSFLIMERKYDMFGKRFRVMLMDSATFCGYKLTFSKSQVMYDHYSDTYNGIPENFPSAIGKTKREAQNKAAEVALRILSQYCYTVKYLKCQKEVLFTDIFDTEATSANSLMTQPLKHKTQSDISLLLKDSRSESILPLENIKTVTQPLKDSQTDSILPLKNIKTETQSLKDSQTDSILPLENIKTETQSLKDSQTDSILPLKNIKTETQSLKDSQTDSILPLKNIKTETQSLKDSQTDSILPLKNIKTELQPLKDSQTESILPLKNSRTEYTLPLKDSNSENILPLTDSKTERLNQKDSRTESSLSLTDSETESSLPLKDSEIESTYLLKDSETESTFLLKDSKTESTSLLKDSETESTGSETEQEIMLDRDQQENVRVHTRPNNTCETRMLSLASESINFECTALKEKDLLSDILDSGNTSSNVLVNDPLKSPVSDNSWTNAKPRKMPSSGFQGNNNTLINTTKSQTYETQKMSSNLETVSSDVAHLENSFTSSNLETVSSDEGHRETSFGSKMLKRMGWAGGGLGKDESGIKEPISTTRVLGRFGIGHKKRVNSDKQTPVENKGKDEFKREESQELQYCAKEEFKRKVQMLRLLKRVTDETFQDPIRGIIRNFVENTEDLELPFSRKFSSRQRKVIQRIANEYNLRIGFFGQISKRHLVLFRDNSTDDFLQHVCDQSQNDRRGNYVVIPPSTDHY